MKSLYIGVLLAMTCVLSSSLLVFLLISNNLERSHLYPVFDAMDELQLENARSALLRGGAPGVAAYMDHLDLLFGVSHYLLDSQGVDVVSSQNRSPLLPRWPADRSRGYVNGRLVISHKSKDGQFWFVAVNPRQPNRWTFFPYYLLVIGATGILCWMAAVGVVSPIRKITSAVDRFGSGDLFARVNMKRADEIGGLARSFDGTAQRLQTLMTSQTRLLQDISHELRSPLARLTFAVRLARSANNLDLAFDRVQREVNRITTLVSEIITLTQIEGDPNTRKAEIVAIDEVIRESVADSLLEAEIRGCKIDLTGRISAKITGNRELLRRAVENVLRNAIRYSPENTAIKVAIDRTADGARITVRDYGPGVPDDALAQIFQPFVRLEDARDAESGGIGLGLSIAKRAVQLHEGRIIAENASPGLLVQILLPVNWLDTPAQSVR